ncbi:dephospho-CoA kinase [Limosilactobacillus fastidiosus]|uniref:Dephospho-CoA kinase n=1 Tax=Limosilactobacillus fastidiosus TaxID=2759855 RepID=A0A7W3YCJ9_9LACO|nr:dephospho-CoA kinase [Limosilactobacillus fastidiosus]MBB1063682.1 dephospho-CoA kinase [Limosilactobacillus fastidiosus]MBB1086789.1 dephospho-CoA kinase [Limosilactobacillus fastidiosus]MCD7084257.1 dephospho-CoA kinase [Limosilactobacillus fastidiosus]MCD7085484.1 dephospho-CoA kinase [Limosilactobacillus fastidiosus]MCD7114715.1 dephospho-CoA kinase [Limosilactobacillus fastidiosus]
MTKIIGLTGGIASGKSTVSNLLRLSGYPIVDADQITRRLQAAHSKGLEQLVTVFGEQILNPDQTLNRYTLGSIVFNDQEKLNKLNIVMQPLIYDEIWRQVKHYRKQQLPYVILDVPLLFEANYANDCDLIIVVTVDRQTQLQRLMHRNGYSKFDAEQRINSQMSLAKKEKRADIVINNSGNRDELERQVANLIDQMRHHKL